MSPTELVTRWARGSLRHWVKAPVSMTYWYSAPGVTLRTSIDQLPLPSPTSGLRLDDQLLKLPAIVTAAAFGAHTRKAVPAAPGTGDG